MKIHECKYWLPLRSSLCNVKKGVAMRGAEECPTHQHSFATHFPNANSARQRCIADRIQGK